MDTRALSSELRALHQLEIDAIAAYDAALTHATGRELQEQLLFARNQHRRHAAELRGALEELGEVAPGESLDLKGHLWRGLASTASRIGQNAALASVLGGEQLACRRYRSVRRETGMFSALLDRHLEDEKHHLELLHEALGSSAP